MRIRNWIVALSASVVVAGCQLPLIIGTPAPGSPTVPPPGPEATPSPSPLPPVTAVSSPTTDGSAPTTPTPAQPVATPSPTAEIFPYILQPGAPVPLPNFAHPDLGCFWMGVGGQVFDAEGQVVKSVVVELGGELAGIAMSDLKVAGGATDYGPGGFEFTLAQRPLGSENTLWLRLYDLGGKALSERIFFSTYNDCQRNLILLNFLEVPVPVPVEPTAAPTAEKAFPAFLPWVSKP